MYTTWLYVAEYRPSTGWNCSQSALQCKRKATMASTDVSKIVETQNSWPSSVRSGRDSHVNSAAGTPIDARITGRGIWLGGATQRHDHNLNSQAADD